MSFNKRYISEETLRIVAFSCDYEYFYKYFLSDALFLKDDFSTDIYNEIQKCEITDKEKILKLIDKCKVMDIGSGKGYPSAALSNFSPHPFVFDGVECNSFEGFIQSVKFSSVEMQREVCKLVGKAAKFKGKKKKWFKDQLLYWNGGVENPKNIKNY